MKQITVLFCDIVNSPPLTKHLALEGMCDLVNAFLEVSLAEVRRYGVPRRNLEADGFMALS
jgi:class 3 adenylate cyclase